VVGVADPDARVAAAMKELAPAAEVFARLDTLLESLQPDVVHVVTPPQTHATLGRLAIDAGCHVYIEKPFVATVAEARDLFARASARRLTVCAGHQLLYEAPARRLRELVPAVGSISHIESYFSFRPVRRTPDGRVPLRADLQLLDILPHPVYLLLSMLEQAGSGPIELTATEVGAGGTIHALLRRGATTGVLTVTLEGRPVESYVRVVGSNGSVYADFVRGTVQRHIGPGTSGIDKLLAPYQLAWQLGTGTTAAMSRRVMKRQRFYPGLSELFSAFYDAARGEGAPPMTEDSVVQSVRVWEEVAKGLANLDSRVRRPTPRGSQPAIVVTGGTGLLGRAVARTARGAGKPVVSIARRLPASWDCESGVQYLVADLAQQDSLTDAFAGASVVIHCAAETAGGWEEHQANSIDASANAIRAAAAAGVRQFIHVSSMAVLSSAKSREGLSEATPLHQNPREAGPYVWGKLESEKLVLRLGHELGVAVKIVRPGALIDYAKYEPPGRLGRRLGNLFVAMGAPGDRIGAVDVDFAAHTLVWMAEHFDEAPELLNLVAPALPSRRELVQELRRRNPDLRVIWLPTVAVRTLSGLGIGLQRVLRPHKPAMNVARAFASPRIDNAAIQTLARRMNGAALEG
jgi:predicted dehydrogenase/nucleoside-diphosphate-sugar epimerase